MESKNIETEVTNFEKYVGPLTENYPFDFPLIYGRKNGYCTNYSKPLTLKQDGTYEAHYVFGYNDSYTSKVKFFGYGRYHYSVKDRTLTLEPERKEAPKNVYKFQALVEKGVFDKHVDEFFHKKLVIPNFTWISTTILFPWARLNPNSPGAAYEDVDYNNPVFELAEISCEDEDNGEVRFLRILDIIETLNKGQPSPSTITEPVKYGDLVLNPDGSFNYYNSTSSWDRDGPYNWDSSFKATGKWNYDFENKVMRLTYEHFKYNDNGKEQDPSKDELFAGKVVETTNFYFSCNYILGISCGFSWSTPSQIGASLLRKTI